MFSNYFKIALRQLRTKPLYTGLNITGLSPGVASCLLITLYVAREFSYGRWVRACSSPGSRLGK